MHGKKIMGLPLVYTTGVVWETRKKIKLKSIKNKIIRIPRGKFVLLMDYCLGRNSREQIVVLWDGQLLFSEDIDTVHVFKMMDGNDVK